MVTLYCRHKLNMTKPNEEYQALIDYCSLRLDKCKWSEKKMVCKNCPVHYYKPEMREKIRKVMIGNRTKDALYNHCSDKTSTRGK